ncbi:MAG TPA: hypothetical protein VFP22_10130 [Candidatus Limnocylindrales bacterium]|nr:hypothetical protein [Candidatus Limnocylindrales bacterium]
MSRTLVTRLLVAGIGLMVVGLATGGAICLLFAGSLFTLNGPDVTGIQSTPFAGILLVLAIAAAVVLVAGAVATLVARVGTLVNTSRFEDKTWLVLMVVLGIWSFGIVAVVAYLVAGPDRDEATASHRAHVN